MRRLHAVVVIQNAFRVYRARTRFLRQRQAAVALQSMFRWANDHPPILALPATPIHRSASTWSLNDPQLSSFSMEYPPP